MAGLAIVIAAPSIVVAAENSAPGEGGTWLGLMFFAINFALFVGILIYFVAPMAGGFFRDRAAAIRSQIDRLNSAAQEALNYANRAESKLKALDQELSTLRSEIESETAFLVKRIREGATATAERIRKDTALTGSAIADAAQRRVRERLAATAAKFARDLIAASIDASDQARLIDGFMEKISHETAR
jgi:F0F1-type ATP synthase membrane subunit b/b'